MNILFHLIPLFFLVMVTNSGVIGQSSHISLDIQGHRGWKGKFPENSIIGFIKAAQRGVTTLEMDVVIAKDGTVIVSHEPWMSSHICLDPLGKSFGESAEKSFNIYEMTYEEVKKFDCGSKTLPAYPDQKKVKTYKPALAEVLTAVENLFERNDRKIYYNVEIKSHEKGDGVFHPAPKEFVQAVLTVIQEHGVTTRTTIQSFDIRPLQELYKYNTQVQIALLASRYSDPLKEFEKLGFYPDIFSPNYKEINKSHIEMLHQDNIQIIPWTVNKPDKMKKLIDMGVDGIITDYPGILLDMLQK